jgi:hypothetical protein
VIEGHHSEIVGSYSARHRGKIEYCVCIITLGFNVTKGISVFTYIQIAPSTLVVSILMLR